MPLDAQPLNLQHWALSIIVFTLIAAASALMIYILSEATDKESPPPRDAAAQLTPRKRSTDTPSSAEAASKEQKREHEQQQEKAQEQAAGREKGAGREQEAYLEGYETDGDGEDATGAPLPMPHLK